MNSKATTSLFINKHSPNSRGQCSISVRVTFERVKKYYPTGISLTELEFQKILIEKPKKGYKELALKLQALENKAASIIMELPIFSFRLFEKHFYTNRGIKDSVNDAFLDYIKELRMNEQIGTAVSYECSRKSINKFAPNIKFADVTPEFLYKYEKWMLTNGKSVTTLNIYLRSLRAIFNTAISEGLLTNEYYPFGKKKYEIPSSNNIKKSLSLNDISKIYFFEAEKGSTTERCKDYWLFMYLCNGINMKDFCLLKYGNIKQDILEFERAKTARTKRKIEAIRIPLSDDAKAIIKKWGNLKQSNNTFIFPVLESGLNPERERQLIQQMTHLINDHLKLIAKSLKIESPITTYVARHSFATILKRSGASTEFIGEALGHSNVRTTQNYLAGFEDESKKEIIKALTAFKK